MKVNNYEWFCQNLTLDESHIPLDIHKRFLLWFFLLVKMLLQFKLWYKDKDFKFVCLQTWQAQTNMKCQVCGKKTSEPACPPSRTYTGPGPGNMLSYISADPLYPGYTLNLNSSLLVGATERQEIKTQEQFLSAAHHTDEQLNLSLTMIHILHAQLQPVRLVLLCTFLISLFITLYILDVFVFVLSFLYKSFCFSLT